MELFCPICGKPLMEKETTDVWQLKLFLLKCENDHEHILQKQTKYNSDFTQVEAYTIELKWEE